MKIKAIRILILALFCASAAAYADGKEAEDAVNEFDPMHQGF